jgi:hypothetical protein
VETDALSVDQMARNRGHLAFTRAAVSGS